MEAIRLSSEGSTPQIISADRLRLELGQTPRRYYYHGWQSWSLAAWIEADRRLPVQRPYFLHPLQIDPAWAFHPRPNGSWVGAVEGENGRVVLLGSLELDAHVELDGTALVGWYETGSGPWFIAQGDESQVFDAYAQELATRLGTATNTARGGVWCSWYSMYTDIDEPLLHRTFEGLADLPFEVLQVDDGWQRSVGDWEPNAKFPSGMPDLARRIRAAGKSAGLWLAPLVAVRSSRLFQAHPDWFLRDGRGRPISAGVNWGEQLHALDTTQPAVLDWLTALMRQVRAWGFDYLKLDFLYASGLPGVRRQHMPREAALRRGLKALRDGMGTDAFFVACGCPILPSLGLCDALRVGPDVWSDWENRRDEALLHNPAIPGARSAVRTTVNRLWLQPIVIPDPDIVYFRSTECDLTEEQKNLLQALALICRFRATSDPPQWLSAEEREQLRAFLLRAPKVERLGPRRYLIDGFEVDFGRAAELTHYEGLWNTVAGGVVGWLANQPWALKIDSWMWRRAAEKRMAHLREDL